MHDSNWLQAALALCVGLAFAAPCPASKNRVQSRLTAFGHSLGTVPGFSRRAGLWIAALALGWWISYAALAQGLELRMSPAILGKVRSENWAGCAGLWTALLIGLWMAKNRVGLMLSCYGALAGGYGFALGDFINKPDKVQWLPFYSHEWLRGFDHWKWTEQSFGFIMGFGVALGLLRLLRGNLEVESGDAPEAARLNDACAVLLLIAIPCLNFHYNIQGSGEAAATTLLGIPLEDWIYAIAAAAFGIVGYALMLHRRGRLPMAAAPPAAKGQALFLLLMYACVIAVTAKAWDNLGSRGGFFIYASFWMSVLACTALAISARPAIEWSTVSSCPPEDPRWRLGWRHVLLWLLAIPVIAAITAATLAMHDGPLPGSHIRFGPEASHLQSADR